MHWLSLFYILLVQLLNTLETDFTKTTYLRLFDSLSFSVFV